MILELLTIVISVVITIIGFIQILKSKKKFGVDWDIIIELQIYLFSGSTFIVTFILSNSKLLDESVALILWKISIIMGLITICVISFVHNHSLEKRPAFFIIPAFIQVFMITLIASQFFLKNSVKIIELENGYLFSQTDPVQIILPLIYSIFQILFNWYLLIRDKSLLKDIQFVRLIVISEIGFSISTIIFLHYLISPNVFITYTTLIEFIFGEVLILFLIQNKGRIFILSANSIDSLVIFHRSGILLYTYNFNKNIEGDESILKGTILIGISHILGNFSRMRDQLNLIKMKERDLIFEYDADLGFAMILITQNKTLLVDNAVARFLLEFRKRFWLKLEEISQSKQLIDISEFRDTKKIVKDCFSIFIP